MSNEVIQEKRIYLPNSCLVGELTICVKNRPLVLLWYVDTTLILDPFSFPSTTPQQGFPYWHTHPIFSSLLLPLINVADLDKKFQPADF